MAKDNMHDVRRTESELKKHEAEDRKRWSAVERSGIDVHLSHDHVRKLGMHKKLPKAGDTMHLHAKVKVKHVETHTNEGGEPRHTVHLEITHAHVQPHERDVRGAIDDALSQGPVEDSGAEE